MVANLDNTHYYHPIWLQILVLDRACYCHSFTWGHYIRLFPSSSFN